MRGVPWRSEGRSAAAVFLGFVGLLISRLLRGLGLGVVLALAGVGLGRIGLCLVLRSRRGLAPMLAVVLLLGIRVLCEGGRRCESGGNEGRKQQLADGHSVLQ